MPGPGGGCLVPGMPGPGGGCLVQEGAWSWGVCSGGAWWRPPGWLLLWAVRILLECILVKLYQMSDPSGKFDILFIFEGG